MGCKAAVQVLQQADILKAKLCKTGDLLNDSEAWTNQQQLQTIYHQVLVLDLEYALDKKVEQELWQLGFKNHIAALQDLAKDKKNPKRPDSQALLSWCLEAASGFYLTLLHEFCTTFDLDLPFRRPGAVYGQLKTTNSCEQVTIPQSSSCLYICQYCLVHLGDIARYRNQRSQAETFYKQAIHVSPTSGQPYNQLALLEASQRNRLSTVFHYVRAIGVKNPFPASSTNLSTTLSSAIDKDEPISEIQTKMSVNKLMRLFLHVHGLLHSATDLEQADIGVKSINAALTALVATESFTSEKLIKKTVINMYALWKLLGNSITKNAELTKDEVKVRELILDLIAGSLSAFLLPVYTLKNDETLLDYYALPAIKLICYWIEKTPDILAEQVFTTRLQIWPGFCKLLNNIQEHIKEFKYERFTDVPLSEDKELQGFLPLSEAFKPLNFKLDVQNDTNNEKFIRAKRLVNFGVWLTNHQINNSNLIISVKNSNEQIINFEPGSVQPDPTDQLLELMKSVNITETIEVKKTKGNEKRTGILKPQGSLERSREQQQQNTSDKAAASAVSIADKKLKRVKQNVALQSIFKKMEENKQVKFIEGTTQEKEPEKPKEKPAIGKNPMSNSSGSTAALNQQYRTQTFNQNHPALSSTLHQDFYNSNVPKMPDGNNVPQNVYFPYSDPKNNLANTLSKIPQTIQFSIPPPQQQPPIRSVPPQNQPFAQPPPMDKSMMPPPPIPVQMPYQNAGFRNWPADDRGQHLGGNWWSSQQMAPPPPGDNFQRDYGAGPFGGMNFQPNRPMNVDFNQGQGQGNMYNPWGNPQRNPPMGGGFPPPSQGMSMRQAMLNETKHIGLMGNNPGAMGNNMPKPSDGLQQANTPGYSLFDTNWSSTLGHLRTPDNVPQRQSQPHPLFSGQSHSTLMQLLEQQSQYKKNDK